MYRWIKTMGNIPYRNIYCMNKSNGEFTQVEEEEIEEDHATAITFQMMPS